MNGDFMPDTQRNQPDRGETVGRLSVFSFLTVRFRTLGPSDPGWSASPMTRSAWVTVRLPGTTTAPAISTRMWLQTGAVKHGRNTASQDARIAGTGSAAGIESMRSGVIGVLESRRTDRARVADAII